MNDDSSIEAELQKLGAKPLGEGSSDKWDAEPGDQLAGQVVEADPEYEGKWGKVPRLRIQVLSGTESGGTPIEKSEIRSLICFPFRLKVLLRPGKAQARRHGANPLRRRGWEQNWRQALVRLPLQGASPGRADQTRGARRVAAGRGEPSSARRGLLVALAGEEAVDFELAASSWLDEGFALLALYGIREDGSCACGSAGCE